MAALERQPYVMWALVREDGKLYCEPGMGKPYLYRRRRDAEENWPGLPKRQIVSVKVVVSFA